MSILKYHIHHFGRPEENPDSDDMWEASLTGGSHLRKVVIWDQDCERLMRDTIRILDLLNNNIDA